MYLRLLTILSVTLLFAAFTACGDDEPQEPITDNLPLKNQWTDSIFGTLSEKDQYYQHLIVEIPQPYQSKSDSLVSWIAENQPGALKFDNWKTDSISILKNRLDTLDIIQPFFYTNYFDQLSLKPYPYWKASEKNGDVEMARIFSKARMNLLDLGEDLNMDKPTIEWLDTIRSSLALFPVIAHYDDKHVKRDFNDFVLKMQRFDHSLMLNISFYDTVNFDDFRNTYGYEGLFIAETEVGKVNNLISGGIDFVFRNLEAGDTYSSWKGSTDEMSKSTRRILDFKSRVNPKPQSQNLEAEVTYTRMNLAHNGAALLRDEGKMIPFQKRFTIYAAGKLNISNRTRKEVNVSTSSLTESMADLKRIKKASGNKVLIISDTASVEVLKFLNELNKEDQTLVCFTNPAQYKALSNTAELLFIPHFEAKSAPILAQQLSSRLELSGNLVMDDSVVSGISKAKTLLARTIPEYTGIDGDTLNRINWAVKQAMNGRAFPGCQVLIAKNGCIIYDQQFGHHTYKREKLVTDESIYDLASITKVVSTTLVGMKLWEMGVYDLQDSLYMYLPDSLKNYLDYPSTIRNITFHELFIHKSGLPAGFPLIRYLQYTNEDIGVFDKYYCDISDTSYCIEVAKDFYMDKEYADSMWLKLNQMWLDKSKPYKYSDVNMNTLYYMFKGMIDANPREFGFTQPDKKLKEMNLYEEFLYETFYRPLGMDRTRYKPLEHYNQTGIVPTEDESYWRHQLLHGSVHDPNAALMGGVAGNAGMFSTTRDLAIYCEMLMNKGVYGGQRYLKAETVEKFTNVAENSHRGLGFNHKTITTTGYGMADSSSLSTYGHTGFTGTCFWIDPEEDMFYIFLSNRVHPKVNNRIYQFGIRKRIHNAAYEARMNS
jgi:CubicO group peptidase (beta-lactamase class C family)